MSKLSSIQAIFILPIFFPYIGFLSGFDVQPIWLVCLAFVAIACLMQNKLSVLKEISIVLASYSAILIAFQVFAAHSASESLDPVVIVHLTLLIALTIACSVRSYLYKAITPKLILVAWLLYVIVAFVQMFVYPQFLAFLVDRDVGQIDLLIESGRGVRSLAPEPSQFSNTVLNLNLFFLVAFVSRYGYEQKSSSRVLCVSIAMWISSIVFAQSLYSASMYSLFLVSLLFSLRKSLGTLGVILPSALICFFLSIVSTFFASSRLWRVGSEAIGEVGSIFQYGAANKLLNLPVSILAMLDSGGLGIVLGGDSFVSILGHSFIVKGRIHGGLVEFILFYGVFFLPLLVYLFILIASAIRGPSSRLLYCSGPIFLGLFLGTFIYGSPLLPFFPLVFALCIRSKELSNFDM
jgi:hypothetical protein